MRFVGILDSSEFIYFYLTLHTRELHFQFEYNAQRSYRHIRQINITVYTMKRDNFLRRFDKNAKIITLQVYIGFHIMETGMSVYETTAPTVQLSAVLHFFSVLTNASVTKHPLVA